MRLIAVSMAVLALASTDAAGQRRGRDPTPVATPTPAPSSTPTPAPTVAATADPRLDAAAGFGAAYGYAYGDAVANGAGAPPPRRSGSIAEGAPAWHASGDDGVVTTSTGVGVVPHTATTRRVGRDSVVTTTTSEFAEPAAPARPAHRRRARR